MGYRAYRTPGLAAVTASPGTGLARRYGPVVAQAGTCACRVHVGVPSRDLGVQVLARPLTLVCCGSVGGLGVRPVSGARTRGRTVDRAKASPCCRKTADQAR